MEFVKYSLHFFLRNMRGMQTALNRIYIERDGNKSDKPPRHKLHIINNFVETQESYFFSIQNLGIIPPINCPLKHNGVPIQFFI